MTKFFSILILLLLVAPASSSAQTSAMKRHVRVLTAPALEGRASATAGAETAREYIQTQFQKVGLEPAGEDGWVVEADFVESVDADSTLEVGQRVMAPAAEYRVLGFSGDAEIEGRPLFVGYGLSLGNLGYDDYAGEEVRGRVVIALTGLPKSLEDDAVATRSADLRTKAAVALSKGAEAIVFVNDPRGHGDETTQRPDTLMPLEPDFALDGIGVVHMTLRVALELVPDLPNRQGVIDGSSRPRTSLLESSWSLEIETDREIETAKSLVGRVAGGKGPLVIVGAHYDGLGTISGDDDLELTYEGADDNASGVAVLIEAARRVVREKPEAQVYFVATDAEERRLRGARVTSRFLRAQAGVGTYINMDMVGRMRSKRIEAFAPLHATLVEKAAQGLKVSLQEEGASRSDHIAFRDAGFEVIHLTTGRHLDYHQVTDVASKLDFSGMARIVDLIERLVKGLAS